MTHGYKPIVIIANGTDIIELGISFFSDIGADKLWLHLELETNCRTFKFMTALSCI